MGKYSINKLPSDILRDTAANVAKIRKNKHWTQLELSERSGVSYGSIKRFERTGKISFESLLMITEALDRLSEFETILIPNDMKRIEKLFETRK